MKKYDHPSLVYVCPYCGIFYSAIRITS